MSDPHGFLKHIGLLIDHVPLQESGNGKIAFQAGLVLSFQSCADDHLDQDARASIRDLWQQLLTLLCTDVATRDGLRAFLPALRRRLVLPAASIAVDSTGVFTSDGRPVGPARVRDAVSGHDSGAQRTRVVRVAVAKSRPLLWAAVAVLTLLCIGTTGWAYQTERRLDARMAADRKIDADTRILTGERVEFAIATRQGHWIGEMLWYPTPARAEAMTAGRIRLQAVADTVVDLVVQPR